MKEVIYKMDKWDYWIHATSYGLNFLFMLGVIRLSLTYESFIQILALLIIIRFRFLDIPRRWIKQEVEDNEQGVTNIEE